MFFLQVLLLKPAEFRARVNEVCRTMNPGRGGVIAKTL